MIALARSLRLSRNPAVAIVGAGGKTTALFRLAAELRTAVATTTTHLGQGQVSLADRHLVWAEGQPAIGAGVTLLTGPLDSAGNRYTGLPEGAVAALRRFAHERGLPLLIEADGSGQRPLKAPAGHEPAVPACADLVVVTAGLQGLGKPLGDAHVHRCSVFSRLGGCESGAPVTAENLARVLAHPEGGLKNVPATARRVVLLNQADTPELAEQGRAIVPALLSAFESVILARLRDSSVLAVHERVAAVVLAAGASRRFGGPKQLLDYRGRPFVCAAAATALEAGLAPVLVVTGAHADQVEEALRGLPVSPVRNPEWEAGQSTSVRAGVAKLPATAGAAVFLQADQPHVTPEVVRALVDEHARGLHPIVAPRVGDDRTNPVLFDRSTFADLALLMGDAGGRSLFVAYEVKDLPWADETLALDVDTPEDYRRLSASSRRPCPHGSQAL